MQTSRAREAKGGGNLLCTSKYMESERRGKKSCRYSLPDDWQSIGACKSEYWLIGKRLYPVPLGYSVQLILIGDRIHSW